MKYKWVVLLVIIVFYLMGTVALGYIAFTSTPPSSSSVFIEVVKIVFLCFGGLGVIVPIYINATNAMEDRAAQKIENTFELLVRWDDPHLFAARNFTREIKQKRSRISDNELVEEINQNSELKQSVILVANYFEHIRFSILNERIDVYQFKNSLGPIVLDILKRFKPFYKSLSQQHFDDFEKLEKLLE